MSEGTRADLYPHTWCRTLHRIQRDSGVVGLALLAVSALATGRVTSLAILAAACAVGAGIGVKSARKHAQKQAQEPAQESALVAVIRTGWARVAMVADVAMTVLTVLVCVGEPALYWVAGGQDARTDVDATVIVSAGAAMLLGLALWWWESYAHRRAIRWEIAS